MIKLPELGYEEVSKLSEADKRNAGYALIGTSGIGQLRPGCSFRRANPDLCMETHVVQESDESILSGTDKNSGRCGSGYGPCSGV